MITITNSADTAKILISGEIGQSFWGDGFTLDMLKSGIGSEDVTNIELEINSLGGDLIEALAIYDTLKTSNARVKAKIIGSTASAGTVIAMGADEIEISENSNFLIHRASTLAAGNVDEMERAADELAMWDEKLLNIYQKRTGKRKSQISDLMKQDKWLTSTEAINWRFADRKIKEQKPILNKTEMDTTKIKTLLNVADDTGIETAIEALQAENTRLAGIVNQVEADKAAQVEADIETYVTEAVTTGKITAETKEKYIALAKSDFEAVKTIIESAKPAPLNSIIDPVESQKPVKMTPELLFSNFKKGVYVDNIEMYKTDYKAAYGKEAR